MGTVTGGSLWPGGGGGGGAGCKAGGCRILWDAERLRLVEVKGEELLALPKEKTLLRWVRAGETRFCGRPCSVLCEK